MKLQRPVCDCDLMSCCVPRRISSGEIVPQSGSPDRRGLVSSGLDLRLWPGTYGHFVSCIEKCCTIKMILIWCQKIRNVVRCKSRMGLKSKSEIYINMLYFSRFRGALDELWSVQTLWTQAGEETLAIIQTRGHEGMNADLQLPSGSERAALWQFPELQGTWVEPCVDMINEGGQRVQFNQHRPWHQRLDPSLPDVRVTRAVDPPVCPPSAPPPPRKLVRRNERKWCCVNLRS